jgi:sulfur carrier protein
MKQPMMTLKINGSPQQFEARINLAQLLENMQLTGKRVAVERNGEIVPRSQYAQVELLDGDQLEIVVAVGGG